MYFLVYFAVLRIDDEFQLAHAHWIVPLPHLRRCESDTDTDAYANAHADSYTNTDSNSDAHTDTNSDACACPERAEQSRRISGVTESDQLVVD